MKRPNPHNTFLSFTSLLLLFCVGICFPAFSQNWRLIQPVYATTSTFVAGFSVADYGATGDGVTDVTSIFQGRLNALSALGGGTLFVPSGKYVISGNLLIPKGITLRGEWRTPVKGQPIVGTILMAYAGRGNESAAPFITMQPSSGVMDVAIWYPQQLPNSITPYPPSIVYGDANYFGNDFCNAKNVTFVNSYTGLAFSRLNTGSCPIINGLYGTPLSRGVEIDNIADVGHMENISFSPAYWAGSGLPGAPGAGSAFESWIYQNGTGIVMRRNDWSYTCFVSIEGYNKGFYAGESLTSAGSGPNGHNYAMTFTHCKTGLYLDVDSGVGIMFSRITTTGCETGVYMGPGTVGVVQLHTSSLAGTSQAIEIAPNAQTRFMVQQCTIAQGTVHVGGGTFTASDCDFNNAAPQVKLEQNSRGIITANRFSNAVRIENKSDFVCAIDQTPLTLKKLPTFPVITPETHLPASNAFYVVTQAPFNARPDGVTDNTAAIQAALNQAAAAGGVVFLPPGKYKVLGHLSIPAGVELKGSVDNSTAAMGPGSVLEAYADRGSPGGTPFVRMAANSGIRGITFNYPEQVSSTLPGVPAYPYCIQVTGANAYIVNVAMRAVYNGIDLFTNKCDNHYVDFLAGHVFKRGITVGGRSTGGKIYNTQFNPVSYAFGFESKWGSWPNSLPAGNSAAYDYAFAALDFLTVGDCASELLYNNFVYGANRGMVFASPNGTGPTGKSLGLGIDGTRTGIALVNAGASAFDLLNTQLVALGDTSTRYLTVAPTFTSAVNFYSADFWGNPGRSITQRAGTVNMQLSHFAQPGQLGFATVGAGATLNLYNSSVTSVPAILSKGNEARFSARSSIIDSTRIKTANALAWKNNLTNTWLYAGNRTFDLPGVVEAENYMAGGQGVAYNDTDPTNNGGQYRPTEGVDIANCSEGGYSIGWNHPGEWLKYAVNVTTAGTYQLQARLACPLNNQTLHIEMDGVNVSGPIAVPNTGSYTTWQTVTVTTSALTVGPKVMRLVVDGGDFDVNYVAFGLPASPLVGQTLVLRGNNSLFVSNAAGNSLNCTQTVAGAAESFTVVDAGNGTVALRNQGKYVSSQNGAAALTCRDTVITAQNRFVPLTNANGTLSFQGNNGKFICSENGSAAMTCNRAAIAAWEQFNYSPATPRAAKPLAATGPAVPSSKQVGYYPNPVQNTLLYTLPLGQPHTLTVRTNTGQQLFTQVVNTDSAANSVDTSSWAPGIYLVQVVATGFTQSFKIVKL